MSNVDINVDRQTKKRTPISHPLQAGAIKIICGYPLLSVAMLVVVIPISTHNVCSVRKYEKYQFFFV